MECQQVHSLESLNQECLTPKVEGFESDHESHAYSVNHSSASEELDNLQLDLNKINSFDLIQLEEVSDTLEQECPTLEAQGFNLDAKSLFVEDRKPAAMPEAGEVLEDSKSSAKSDGNVTAIADSGATEGLNNADSWGVAPTDVPRIVQIPFDPGGLSPDVIYPEKPEQKWLDEISTQQMKEHCTTTVDKLGIEIVCNNNASSTINDLDDYACREFFIDT